MTRGYTLLEILVAVTLMLIIMLGLTQLFSSVGTQINNTQATLQLAGDLRGVKTRLESDLKLVTADLSKAPPMKSGLNQGYFCIIEGMGAAHSNALLQTRDYANPSLSITGEDIAFTSDSNDPYDNTVGDMDDILMFTAYAPEGQPFRGLVGGQVRESNMAEIIWFCRGNTLYRRTLLILPDQEFQDILARDAQMTPAMRQGLGFYQRNDVSVRINPNTGFVVANSLEDLAQRQNRFGHAVSVAWNGNNTVDGNTTNTRIQQAFPFNIHKNSAVYYMRMPTMLETSHPNWDASQSFAWNLAYCTRSASNHPYPTGENPILLLPTGTETSNDFPQDAKPFIDFWVTPFPWSAIETGNANVNPNINPITGTPVDLKGGRYAEDVIMTNVISFDIQVWDDYAKRYVNLGEARSSWNTTTNRLVYTYDDGTEADPSGFGAQGNYPLLRRNPNGSKNSTLNSIALPCTYDTWSDEFEREGYQWPNQAGTPTPTRGRNQIDDLGTGVIDHIDEWTTSPPYNVPLRGVKISIRTFDPLSKNIREMTVVHNFVGR